MEEEAARRRVGTSALDDEERSRFLGFSDGVFAFAATLLVVNLVPPDVRSGELSQLPQRLLETWPAALAYAISFLVVARYWAAHRQLFRSIHPLDGGLVQLNIVLLLLIAALPFPSAVLGRYASQVAAVVFYAAMMTAIGAALLAIRVYAFRRGVLHETDALEERQARLAAALVNPCVFAGSIPVAFLSTPADAMYFWIVLIPLNIVAGRWVRRRARRQPR